MKPNQNAMTDFLPQDYEQPKTGGNYMKFENGENRFRILSKPIIGWLDWKDKKPYRFRMNEKPEKPFDPAKAVRHFWAMIVWNYKSGRIEVLEITQAGIQAAITNLFKDADWGAPYGYDIKVSRTGSGLETEYAINPVPHKATAQEIQDAFMSTAVDLERLFDGENPFDVKKGEVLKSDLPF